jgi:RNA polymerase sigma-70 factor (ECF subfamily)
MDDLATTADPVLVVAIGRFRRDALAEVYRRHGGAVHAVARRVTGTPSLADDVTQEVFVDLWKRPERFDAGRGTLRTWLLTAAHSRAVDLVRADVARARREERAARDTAVSGYDLNHFAWDLAMADRLRAALDALPEAERRAIEMAYFEGLTYRQVASELGAPEGTVKSRIRSGLRRLRTALNRLGVEVR